MKSRCPTPAQVPTDAGWRWRIPLQHRAGNGLVYYVTSSQRTLRSNATVISGWQAAHRPKADSIHDSQRKQYWHKTVSLGLSSGFIEPLESTNIHFIQNGIMWLLLMFLDPLLSQASIDEYNHKLRSEAERIRDFIVLHYVANERTGDPSGICAERCHYPHLEQRISLFREAGRYSKLKRRFSENSGSGTDGSGHRARRYHNIADAMSQEQLNGFLSDIQANVGHTVSALPITAISMSSWLRWLRADARIDG